MAELGVHGLLRSVLSPHHLVGRAKCNETKINASATLLDIGNLVLREFDTDGRVKILWQSYDHSNYILLPGMKLGFNERTGQNWSLTSWTGSDTPTKGPFTVGVDPNNKNQLVMRWRGNLYWTSGPLVDGTFPNLNHSGRYKIYFTYVSNENETFQL
ncbi:hypothetical protein Fmac_019959 [Flemingia macrophylla]|uniref:Bulb-type lectin domain-containing protein n=1 Tax=Flemingia macrophylla TaxID=520843 RepID=A0ABD1M9B4_9FABA